MVVLQQKDVIVSEPKAQDERLFVAMVQRIALVRVAGRGSFKTSTALKEFGANAVDHGATDMVVDLRDCANMDSTFMGVLAGMAGRIRTRARGRLILVNLTEKNRALITTLGLSQLVVAYDLGETPPPLRGLLNETEVEGLTPQTESKRVTAETMLEAHELLSSLTPENVPKFKDVLEYLREDVRRRSQSGAP